VDEANDESTSLAIHDDDDAELAECISYVVHAEYACDARDARDALNVFESKCKRMRMYFHII
jgi:hypothetical protein